MATTGNKGKPDPRKERLKAALRENLRRRKAQERGREEATGAEAPESGAEAADSAK
ncbi:hypothetical protein [Pseudolabrys taiwanensis]|uniref:hypothetical protein n=1 Tax=Pseudolabrys taiwanensis TaxID=331696 RepID=UPI001476688C|nr:hypothetical protein [Pseudolabrys taiwanensis]